MSSSDGGMAVTDRVRARRNVVGRNAKLCDGKTRGTCNTSRSVPEVIGMWEIFGKDGIVLGRAGKRERGGP
jgi:hypothetical protein